MFPKENFFLGRQKIFIVTKLFGFLKLPDHKIQLWSQNRFFSVKYFDFLKMDKKKCPKMKNQKTFAQQKISFFEFRTYFLQNLFILH
jgi:hypothetical protein